MGMRLTVVVAFFCVALAALLLGPSAARATFTPSPAFTPRPALALVPVPRVSAAPVMQKTLERPKIQVPDAGAETSPELPGNFRVYLMNDNSNLREFVARAITLSCPLSSAAAYEVMQGAHTSGFALVGIFPHGAAQKCYDGLKKKGLNTRMEEE